MELPIPLENVMVTYKKTFYFGAYSSQSRVETVTRMGFYNDGLFKVPEEWKNFRMNGHLCLLPHGFNPDRLLPKDVISWKYCTEITTQTV